jgi:hypothetical protein
MQCGHRRIVVKHVKLVLLTALICPIAAVAAGDWSRPARTALSMEKLGQAPSQPLIFQGFRRFRSKPVPFFHSLSGFRRHSGGGVWNRVARDPAASTAAASIALAPPTWTALFDGKSLDGWKATNFGGEGEVRVEEGRILLDFGEPITGLTYQGEFPVSDYEIRVQAMRTDGIDFFCGLTFPVGDTHCSFIAAGWAGSVVGLSCIDGRDASENETTKYMNFENHRWYRFRVRVTDDRIAAWIDDQQVIDLTIQGRKVSVRPEVELSTPLGIAAWQSRAAVRELEYRRLR